MNYNNAIKSSVPAFIGSRFIPVLGISLVFLLVAHKTAENLAVFSYVLAVTSVISAFFSLLLATIGNRAAALKNSICGQRDLFTGGFTLALSIAVITSILCLSITYLISHTESARHWSNETFWKLSLIYTASTPFIVINNFLQLYLEATGRANRCANGKIIITLSCIFCLSLLVMTTSSHDFQYWAMSYFFVTELLTLFFLIRLAGKQRYVSWTRAKEHSAYFLRTGIPIAAGMSGQKLYFYLLIERLARLDAHLVAELSVFMTVVGLLIIPSAAFAQVHSLQVSRHIECAKAYFSVGLAWLVGGSMLISMVVYLVGEYVFQLVGGAVIDYTARLALTLIMFLVSSSLLGLAFGHLRALSETLVPQLVINVIMLALLIPAIYAIEFKAPDLEDFLMLQSAAAFVGFLILAVRIMVVHRRMHIYAPAAYL